MKKHERIAAIFLFLTGAAAAAHSWLNLKLGTLQLPDSGFMPFMASMILLLSSGAWLAGTLGGTPGATNLPFWEERGWLKPLSGVGLMLFYAWSMSKLGYLPATLAFMLVWQFFIEREKWLKATLVSVGATLVMWLLFAKLLGVPLPTGMLTV